jgi:hypothetical protein
MGRDVNRLRSDDPVSERPDQSFHQLIFGIMLVVFKSVP